MPASRLANARLSNLGADSPETCKDLLSSSVGRSPVRRLRNCSYFHYIKVLRAVNEDNRSRSDCLLFGSPHCQGLVHIPPQAEFCPNSKQIGQSPSAPQRQVIAARLVSASREIY